MSLAYLVLPDARTDIGEGYAWYEAQTVGRGDAFLAEVSAMITTLQTAPETYGFVFAPLRAAPLPNSRFIVYYTIEPERIEVFGVLHANADPQRWQERI